MLDDEIPANVAAPDRWPLWLALGLGLLCFLASGYCGYRLNGVNNNRDALEKTMEHAVLTQADNKTQQQLARQYEAITRSRTQWARRSLGLGFAGLVLLIGGFISVGVHSLYRRMVWAIVEQPQDSSDKQDG